MNLLQSYVNNNSLLNIPNKLDGVDKTQVSVALRRIGITEVTGIGQNRALLLYSRFQYSTWLTLESWDTSPGASEIAIISTLYFMDNCRRK